MLQRLLLATSISLGGGCGVDLAVLEAQAAQMRITGPPHIFPIFQIRNIHIFLPFRGFRTAISHIFRRFGGFTSCL